MISSMASISSSSSSSATVRVEKATSEFLIGPDWTMNIDICDTINSNQMLAKDVVKALKKRLQHKNPKVQLLALTLLEMMVKNCGDYVHFQIAERKILQELVKIVKKKTDMHVRDKILTLIGSWHEAFGGAGGRYPQYYMAYEDLRRAGVQFPSRPPDPAPMFTPPITQPVSRPPHPPPGYGMPSSSSTRLDEAMAADQTLSLSSINSMRYILDLLTDMLQAVDPSDRSAVKDEVIVDLVEQCRANQRKLMQTLETTGDEELLGQGLEINDRLQSVLAKHDAIASGSPLPPEVTTNVKPETPKKDDSSLKSDESPSMPNTTPNNNPSPPVVPFHRALIDEEEEEEDDFALLARRHSKIRSTASVVNGNAASQETPASPVSSNALVPVNPPTPVQTKDQDIIDLLSITLSTATSTGQTSQEAPIHTMPQGNMPSASPGVTFSSEGYPSNHGLAYNSYVAPWAQPQPQPQPQPDPPYSQPQPQPGPNYAQPQPQPGSTYPQPQAQPGPTYPRPQPQPQPQPALQPQFPQYSSPYPPPPWAATPGYFSNQNPVPRPSYTYSNPISASSSQLRPMQHKSINGDTQVNSNPRLTTANDGQKPFIPSYRLFEDLDVFGNTDGRFKATSNGSSSGLSGSSNNQNMVVGRK